MSASAAQGSHNNLRLRCFKKHHAAKLTKANELARLQHARQLLAKYAASLVNFIVFADEKLFTVGRDEQPK